MPLKNLPLDATIEEWADYYGDSQSMSVFKAAPWESLKKLHSQPFQDTLFVIPEAPLPFEWRIQFRYSRAEVSLGHLRGWCDRGTADNKYQTRDEAKAAVARLRRRFPTRGYRIVVSAWR